MPFLPDLQAGSPQSLYTTEFRGLNVNLSAGDGELAWMENLSSRCYPLLASREPRCVRKIVPNARGIMAKEKLAWIADGYLWYDGVKIDMHESTGTEPDRDVFPAKHDNIRQMVSMGAYLCVFPENVWYNTHDKTSGNMGALSFLTGQTITLTLCRADGTDYDMSKVWVQPEKPADMTNGVFWIDTSQDKHVLKIYNSATKMWEQISTTYIKIQGGDMGLGGNFKQYDSVRIQRGLRRNRNYTKFVQQTQGTEEIVTTCVIERKEGAYLFPEPTYAKHSDSFLPSGTVCVYSGVTIGNFAGVTAPNGWQGWLELNRFVFSTTPVRQETTGLVEVADMEKCARVDKQLSDLMSQELIVYEAGDSYIVVAGILDDTVIVEPTEANPVTIERRVPEMDYVIEHNNRLWGCRHGTNLDGEFVNEIYACKQGDFRNWYRMMGLTDDSYMVSVGTDGPFTGAAVVNGYPTFFKEGCAHRIGGSTPATYTMTTTELEGIQDGCWRSAVVVDGVLYYKGVHCVMRYDGSLPSCASDALGHEMVYSNARAGCYGNRYYLDMQDSTGLWHLFVLDTAKGLWHRENGMKALGFARLGTSLYTIDEATGELIDLNGADPDGVKEERVGWQATFATVGYTNEEQKYLSRFNIRMKMNPGDIVRMYIQYDSDGVWHEKGEMIGHSTRTFMVPVIPRRCDHCQLRLEGEGDVRVFSVGRLYECGGDG